jgi:hypothetical protein
VENVISSANCSREINLEIVRSIRFLPARGEVLFSDNPPELHIGKHPKKIMRIYKLFFTVTSTGTGLIAISIQRAGRIRCIRWSTAFDGPADNANCTVELSLSATATIAVNDTIGVIDEIRTNQNILTSGGGNSAVNLQRTIDFPVAVGDRLMLNAAVNGTVSQPTTCFIDVEER